MYYICVYIYIYIYIYLFRVQAYIYMCYCWSQEIFPAGTDSRFLRALGIVYISIYIFRVQASIYILLLWLQEIFPAGTDSRFLRALGIPAFGFSPLANSPILLHEHNEHVDKHVFLAGIKVQYSTMLVLVKGL